MTVGTVSLRYLILGLLAQQPMSGYDIKRFLKGLSWLIASPSSGSLYPILRTLHKEGLVTVEIVPGLDRPPRKINSITEAGKQALQVWIDQLAVSNAPMKAFVMRLLLAGNFSHAALAAHLQQRRDQVADHQTALAKATEAQGRVTDLGQRLTLEYGLALATAELAWLDNTLPELSEMASGETESIRPEQLGLGHGEQL